MKFTIVLVGTMLAIGSATLVAQDEQPQITPRPTVPVVPGPNAVTKTSTTTTSKPSAPPKAAVTDPDDAPKLVVQNPPPAPPGENGSVPEQIVVPAGTKIPLTLKQGITTKNAHVGDPVYAQTAFPITQNDHIVIPAGTFVQGEIKRVQRPGRVKGRAELLVGFNSLIYPNGYTVVLPAAVHGTPGSQENNVKGSEGTIEGPTHKGEDAAKIAATTIPGAGIGAIAGDAKGAAIGAGVGGALGLATVLLTRGPEIQLSVGDSIEMILERSLTLTEDKIPKLVVGQTAQYQ